ncbi:hypothetical protein [Bacillus niameyensis]|nr:hypothetical protein [Bacillus niameyensis]
MVRDGSTNKFEKGYWTTNMIAVGKNMKHPIPVFRTYTIVPTGIYQ